MSEPGALDSPKSFGEEEAEQLVTTDEEEDTVAMTAALPEDFEDDDENEDFSSRAKTFGVSEGNEGEDGGDEADNEDNSKTQTVEESTDRDKSLSEDSHPIVVLKKPVGDIDDFIEEEISPKASINILEIKEMTREEARNIAEFVIDVLEEDLFNYVQKTGTKFPPPLTEAERKKMLKMQKYGLSEGDSASSFASTLSSEILPGEPSKIKMTYDKGVSVFADLSLMQLHPEEMVDEECQVNLHRHRKKTPAKKFCRYTQTLEMTFIPTEIAALLFKEFYPQMDDFKPPELPSRQASEDFAIKQAEEADPNIDNKRKGPQIIHLSNKKQLLQPLMDDYFKDEKMCTGSRFIGEFRGRQFFKGRYDHPTGATIESEFMNGHFENQKHLGIVRYPRGDKFEGVWRKGRYQTGEITFCDGLKFSTTDWKYCEPPDRRFKVEKYYGMKPAGMTLFSDNYPAPRIPPGTFDVGDGYYNPKTGDVRGYDGFLLRQAIQSEVNWIEKHCRKAHESIEHIAPKFLAERIPGSYVDSQRRLPLTRKIYH